MKGPLPNNILKCMPKAEREALGKGFETAAELDTKAAIESERDLQSQINQFLQQKGILFDQSPFGKKSRKKEGWPDYSFSYRGQACYIEAKAKGGKLSEDQDRVIRQLIAEPNCANVIIASDLSPVKRLLDSIDGKEGKS